MIDTFYGDSLKLLFEDLQFLALLDWFHLKLLCHFCRGMLSFVYPLLSIIISAMIFYSSVVILLCITVDNNHVRVAVAQEEEQLPTNRKFGGSTQATCRSVLGKDTEPHIAYPCIHRCMNVCE